jgi:hypothetical protein
MTIEDTLDSDEIEVKEVEELLFRVACLQRVKTHYQSRLAVAEAYLRFYQAISSLRELDDAMWVSRGDFIVVGRRIRYFFSSEGIKRWFRRPSWVLWHRYVFELRTAWREFRNSCATFLLFASRAREAKRAARAIIYLRQ